MTKQADNNKTGTLSQKILPLLLILTGAGVMIAASGADLVTSGENAGFGPKQIMLILVGIIILLAGVGLSMPVGRRYVNQFIERELTLRPALRLRPTGFMLIAAWFGLVTGLLEVIVWLVLKFSLSRIDPTVLMSPHIVWMAPLANLVYFVVIGLGLSLVVYLWPGLISLRSAAFVFSFMGVVSVLLLIPGLHLLAVLLLATGLGVQTTRMIVGHPARFYNVVRWFRLGQKEARPQTTGEPEAATAEMLLPGRRQFLLNTGVILGGLAVGVGGWERSTEWRRLARIPSASHGEPNVLLIVLDTVRAQNMGLYGYARPTTPNLERLAKSGTVFERAIATAPWTLPSHASMFTGRWHHEVSADWHTALDNTYPTLAETLSEHGYVTAGFVANLDFCSRSYGLDRGFAHYEDFPVSIGQTILSSSLGRELSNDYRVRRLAGYYDTLNRKNATRLTNDFLNWVGVGGQPRQPFFAFLNYYDAHQPYFPPAPFVEKFGPLRPRGEFRYFTNDAERADMWRLSPAEVQVELDAYDGAIAYLDHELGLLLAELARRQILDDTLVIITSDHGEQFDDHGLFGHTNSLYLPTLHVPLLMIFPSRLAAGLRVNQPISLRNLPATVMDLVGLGAESQFPGASLARYWQPGGDQQPGFELEPLLSEINGGGFSWQDWYPVVKGDMKSLVIDRYHYIQSGDGREELYDVEADPDEVYDLAASEEGRQTIGQFRATLDTMLVV